MTTQPDPTFELVETLEYRGETLYVYFRPEQTVTWERDVYGWLKEDHKVPGAFGKTGETEPASQHHDARYYAAFKPWDRFQHTYFNGDTKAKALKSIKHNVDVALADEALRPVLVKLVGYDKTGEITDKFPHATPDTQEGDVVWLFSRGGWRRGLVEKVGRTNVTVAYVTEGGVSEAQKRGYLPVVTRKSAKFEHVVVEPR